MSELHDALSSLNKRPFSDVPLDNLADFLHNAFTQAELIINSVPPPPGGEDLSSAHRTRNDPLPATKASEMTASNVRSPPPIKDHADLQKSWGKPMKIGAKDNPLGVSVYKMAGNDRHGAWFARRSIHEGLGFEKWKHAMQAEFPESLAVHKGPGEGSVRGIGGDRVLESQEVKDVGKLDVLELSAKFPPPTSPRDFVTLLLTTAAGLSECSSVPSRSEGSKSICPRSWMVVSIPVEHPDAPPRDGLVRGQYESVEIIREIPIVPYNPEAAHKDPSSTDPILNADEDPELNPVEWIMVTRSDPGGGIPRFLVDRGTPPSIAADTVKFLDWACARSEHSHDPVLVAQADTKVHRDGRRPSYTSFHQSFTAGVNKDLDRPMVVNQHRDIVEEPRSEVVDHGYVSAIASTIGQTILHNTPAVIRDHIPAFLMDQNHNVDTDTCSSSDESFASAELFVTAETGDGTHDFSSSPTSSKVGLSKPDDKSESQKSLDSGMSLGPSEGRRGSRNRKEILKIEQKKEYLGRKLALLREKQDKAVRAAMLKSEDDAQKTRERHEQDIQKQEERHAREMQKLEERKQKETRKLESRRRKEEERNKLVAAQRERDEWRTKAELLEKENDLLREQVGELQREHTLLVSKVGKAGESGQDLIKSVVEDTSSTRKRGGSIFSKGSHEVPQSI